MIPNQTVEEIFQKARIEEVVSDFLTLKSEVNLLGNCPFHNERHLHSPSRLLKIYTNVLVAGSPGHQLASLWSMKTCPIRMR
ncbi:MAG: hypothetical protein IPN87_05425 [Saprospiraceae bacterium]|nr:hypothetical protein [Candidatus Brachybacter algidus]